MRGGSGNGLHASSSSKRCSGWNWGRSLRRSGAPGRVHPTDQAPLCSAAAYRERMRVHGIPLSGSARGDCHDNAMAESFFSNLKNERVHRCDFASREAARAAIFDYIEVF